MWLENRLLPSALALETQAQVDPTPRLQSISAKGATAGDQSIQSINWNGSQVEAYAGHWILRIDGAAALSGTGTFASSGLTGAQEQAQLTFVLGTTSIQVTRSLGGLGLYSIETPSDWGYEDLYRQLSLVPNFRYVEPDFVLRPAATLPNDPGFSSQWGLDKIQAPLAWDKTTGSHGVVVAVIDSGVDYTHPDLAANIFVNPGEIPDDGIDNDGNGYVDDVRGWDFGDNDNDPMDSYGHGTMVAGVIGAVGNNVVGVTGVNWDVQIMPLKIDGGTFSSSADISAINYAAMMRSRGINIRVANASYGEYLTVSQAQIDAISASRDADILFVAGAGNEGLNTDFWPFYPAAHDIDNIVSVAATDDNDSLAILGSYSSSNFGATSVDLGAPGSFIYTTDLQGQYSSPSGTSLAAPFVTGVAALAAAYRPNATYAEIRDAIFAGVDPCEYLTGVTVTGGRLNAYQTLLHLGMNVLSTFPAQGGVVAVSPSEFVVDFSAPYASLSISALDFRVNGITATSCELTDADTVTYQFSSSPVAAQGLQTMTLTQGAITRLRDGDPVDTFQGSFYFDSDPLQVVSTSPAIGAVATSPLSSIQVRFNEPVDPATVDTSDLVGVTVTGFVFVDETTVRFNIEEITTEGAWLITLTKGAIADLFGNPLGAYSGTIILDDGNLPQAYPALASLPAAGNLVYGAFVGPTEGWNYGFPPQGVVDFVADIDSFTLDLESGQTVSVMVNPGALLEVDFDVTGPGGSIGSAASASAGQPALLQTIPVIVQGTYTITVRGLEGTTGDYIVEVIVNAAIEAEAHGGLANDTVSTAQNIDSSFLDLGYGASRGSVTGGTVNIPYSATAVTPEFIDISRTGMASRASLEWSVETLTPDELNGFTFNFFGTTYDSLSFWPGGLITVLPYYSSYQGEGLNGVSPPAIAPLWYDFLATGWNDSNVYWQVIGTGAGQQLIIQWNDVRPYTATPTGPVTFQAVLSTDGTIQFNYAENVSDLVVGRATVGVVGPGGGLPFFLGDPQLLTIKDQGQPGGAFVGGGLSTRLTPLAVIPPDYYAFSVAAGDRLTLGLAGFALVRPEVLGAHLDLLDASGAVLASGDWSNSWARVIESFVAPASGTYYARVNVNDLRADYTLVATRNIALDTEWTPEYEEETLGSAQPIDPGTGMALGYVQNAVADYPDEDYYTVHLEAGSWITISTLPRPRLGDGPVAMYYGTAPELPDLEVQLYSPDGEFVDYDDNSAADGRNARLSYVVPTTGTYTIRVAAVNDAEGEYILRVASALYWLGTEGSDWDTDSWTNSFNGAAIDGLRPSPGDVVFFDTTHPGFRADAASFSVHNDLVALTDLELIINDTNAGGDFDLTGNPIGLGVGGIKSFVSSGSGARLAFSAEGIRLDAPAELFSLDGLLTIASDVSTGGQLLTVTGYGDTAISGNISGTGGLKKSSIGTLLLNGRNTYTGETTVDDGTLTVAGGEAISDSGRVVVGSFGTLDLLDSETVGSLAGGGAISWYGDFIKGVTASTDMGAGMGTTLQETVAPGPSTADIGGTIIFNGEPFVEHFPTSPLNSWVSAGALTGTITFDLHGTHVLSGLSFCNLNGAGPGDYGSTGIRGVTIQSSTDGIHFIDVPDTPSEFAKVTTVGGFWSEYLGFTPLPTSYIRFIATSNWGDPLQTGFGEVLFWRSVASTVDLRNNTLTTGGNEDTTSFGGHILGDGGLTKIGAGTFTLSGANFYTGPTQIGTIDAAGGTLLVDDSLASDVTVSFDAAHNGTLGGTGTISGLVNILSGGNLAPGASPGLLRIGDLTFADESTFTVEIGGSMPGDDYDQTNVVSGVVIGSNVSLNILPFNGYIPVGTTSFTIVDNQGAAPVVGIFQDLPEGATILNFLGSGRSATISYVGGSDHNDVVISVVNESPQVGAFGGTVSWTEGQPPVLLDGDTTVRDADSADFDGGSLTVQIAANRETRDNLIIRNQGIGAEQIGVSGSNVTFGGIVIGTVAGGSGAAPLFVTFNSHATPVSAQALLRNIMFSSSSSTPSPAPRSVEVTIEDGDGAVSLAVEKTVNVVPVSIAPVLKSFGGAVRYVEGHPPVLLTRHATVTDTDSPNFDTGMLTVQITANAEASDRLSVRNQGNGAGQIGINYTNVTFGGVIIGTLAGGDGESPLSITLNNRATTAAVSALIRNVTFTNVSANPSSRARNIQVVLWDGDGGTSVPVVKKVRVVRCQHRPRYH